MEYKDRKEMIATFHIVLDLEMNPVHFIRGKTTDRQKKLQSEIIEIGAVKMRDGDYEKIDEFSILVRPQHNDRIEQKITSLTGLTYEDVKDAVTLETAIRLFSEWIGTEKPARLYSWSTSDSTQVCHECREKEIDVPENMSDWVDFQKMFPEATGIHTERQLALEYAAELAGVDYDEASAHRALYDAQVTAEIVYIVLSGEYKVRMKNVTGVLKKTVETGTASMAEKLGPKYEELMALFAEKKS